MITHGLKRVIFNIFFPLFFEFEFPVPDIYKSQNPIDRAKDHSKSDD